MTQAETQTQTPPESAQRSEFVRAFVEHGGALPEGERLVARPHTVLLLAVAAAAGALIYGIFADLIHGDSSGTGLSTATAATTAPVGRVTDNVANRANGDYTAISGWDCVGTEDHGFVATGRTGDWLTVSRGGWTGDGCHGTFETMPMSGNASAEDTRQSLVWWFRPGDKMRRCRIEVYVPRAEKGADIGATAAHYSVLSGRSGTSYGEFAVNQAVNAGRWVDAGTYPVNDDEIAVRLGNRGVPDKTVPGARIAVPQLRASCGA